jgi:hypothetical protein
MHLPHLADRRRTFERVAASLVPGGSIRVERLLRDPHVAARLDGQQEQKPVPHTIRYALSDNRVDLITPTARSPSIWWATKNEWFGLIDVAYHA